MKLLTCNGKMLEVRDCGPVVYRLSGAPIKRHGAEVLSDEAARDVLADLKALGCYQSEVVKESI